MTEHRPPAAKSKARSVGDQRSNQEIEEEGWRLRGRPWCKMAPGRRAKQRSGVRGASGTSSKGRDLSEEAAAAAIDGVRSTRVAEAEVSSGPSVV